MDTLGGSSISNLKELRPRSGRDVAVRVLFVFDPWSQAVLLVAGNVREELRDDDGAYEQERARTEAWVSAFQLAEERKRLGLTQRQVA